MLQLKSIIIIQLIAVCTIISSLNVSVPKCTSDYTPNITPFHYTINGTRDNTTTAHMCHDDAHRWFSVDNEIISTYTKCNDLLFNEDAVEIFLAAPSWYPNHYFEFEVSPKGQLFFADITNPSLACSNLGTTYYPCSSATYQSNLTAKGWDAYLKIGTSLMR
jgi:hypothetical protein